MEKKRNFPELPAEHPKEIGRGERVPGYKNPRKRKVLNVQGGISKPEGDLKEADHSEGSSGGDQKGGQKVRETG